MTSPANVVISPANKGSESKKAVAPIFSPPFGISLTETTSTMPVGCRLDLKEMPLTRAKGLVLQISAPCRQFGGEGMSSTYMASPVDWQL